MTTDIDKLAQQMREAARKATPGPWECWGDQVGVDHRRQACCGDGYEECCGHPIIDGNYGPIAHSSPNDAAFIALAGPANLVAILDDRDRLVAAVKEAVVAVSDAARAQGEAEGRLCVSETAGIIDGWRERAERAEADAAHWKANHADLVARNAVLRDRPDLPADRLPALARLEEAMAAKERECEGLREALGQLRKSAAVLQQNAEVCAVNHYGEDFAIHGLPGWLADTAADIERATVALAASGGGNG